MKYWTEQRAVRHLVTRFNERAWNIPDYDAESENLHDNPYFDVYLLPETYEGATCAGMFELMYGLVSSDSNNHNENTANGIEPILSEDDLKAIYKIGPLRRGISIADYLTHPRLPEEIRLELVQEEVKRYENEDTRKNAQVTLTYLIGQDDLPTDHVLSLLVMHANPFDVYAHPNAGPLVAQAYLNLANRHHGLYPVDHLALAANPAIPETEANTLLTMFNTLPMNEVDLDLKSSGWSPNTGILSPDYPYSGKIVDEARSRLIMHSALQAS